MKKKGSQTKNVLQIANKLIQAPNKLSELLSDTILELLQDLLSRARIIPEREDNISDDVLESTEELIAEFGEIVHDGVDELFDAGRVVSRRQIDRQSVAKVR